MKSSNVLIILLLFAVSVAVSSATISTLPAETAVVATLPAPPGGEQGYFSISSSPSYGDVYFDGSFWGETPVVVTVSTTGTPTHNIRITLPGYEEWTSTYNGNPQPGQTISD